MKKNKSIRIGRFEIGWLWFGMYSKPYEIFNGLKYEAMKYYGLTVYEKGPYTKRWGFTEMWYDQPFYFYGLGILTFHWCEIAIPVN